MNQAVTLPDWLRELTRQAHAALERAPVMQRLATPSGATEAYHQLLCGFAGFYEQVEPRLSATLTAEFRAHLQGFDRRRALAADLEAWCNLGAPTPAVTVPPSTLTVSDEATAVGAFYVIEGSTLGARTIRARLQPLLDARLHHCDTFVSARGETTEADWLKARGLIERYGRAHPQQWQAIGAGALGVFAEIHRLLGGSGVSGDHQPLGDRQH